MTRTSLTAEPIAAPATRILTRPEPPRTLIWIMMPETGDLPG